MGPFLRRFGRKTGVRAKQNDTFFRVFAIFEVFLCCKPLPGRNYHRFMLSQKNHTKKPTVGFLLFGASGKIFIVIVEKHTDRVEGKAVAISRLGKAPHRLIRVIRAIRGSLRKLDHGLHGFHGLVPARPWLNSVMPGRTVAGQSNRGRPNTFSKLRALRALCGETKLRSRNSLICRIGLTQVVDFHDIFRYFSHVFNRKPG
jgi:hypothetical protein